jgi:hypothetical protein
MKIRPVGAELLHADGRTDMTNLIVAFRNFANAPKNDFKYEETCSMICLLSVTPAKLLSKRLMASTPTVGYTWCATCHKTVEPYVHCIQLAH